MNKKKLEEISLSIIPFTSEIVGADDKNIFIKEQYFDEKEIDNYCIIKLKKEFFKEMIDLWIERKTEYCKSWNHFCGVFGNIYIDNFTQLGEINLLVGFDENKGEDGELIYKDVPLFEVISFDKHCDMEHG